MSLLPKRQSKEVHGCPLNQGLPVVNTVVLIYEGNVSECHSVARGCREGGPRKTLP